MGPHDYGPWVSLFPDCRKTPKTNPKGGSGGLVQATAPGALHLSVSLHMLIAPMEQELERKGTPMADGGREDRLNTPERSP